MKSHFNIPLTILLLLIFLINPRVAFSQHPETADREIEFSDIPGYQPHQDILPHKDRNRSYQLAREAAKGSDLIDIQVVEIADTYDHPIQ
jgi:hypothetical protein